MIEVFFSDIEFVKHTHEKYQYDDLQGCESEETKFHHIVFIFQTRKDGETRVRGGRVQSLSQEGCQFSLFLLMERVLVGLGVEGFDEDDEEEDEIGGGVEDELDKRTAHELANL